MKKICLGLIVMAMILAANACPAIAGGYVIAEGDVLAINVFGLEEMQIAQIIVRPDGKIDFPLLGEVQVVGRTPSELSRVMTEQLVPYVKNPRVSVNIAQFHSTRVYVLGEINRPGIVELQNSHNVIDAIAAAGSWTKDTAKKKVYLIRNGQKNTEPIIVNLLNIVKKGDMTQNYPLNNGDILFLDTNGRLDWGRDIAPIISSAYYISNFDNNN
ncbi:MAG: kpsD 1 [Firmicutes bacterium]|nr:kpsD 1 [Bacillota bacterium]